MIFQLICPILKPDLPAAASFLGFKHVKCVYYGPIRETGYNVAEQSLLRNAYKVCVCLRI